MSENENGLIMLTADDGSEEAFFVLEKADIAGVSYLLVTDSIAVSYTHLTLPTNSRV